jgi:hypothetical protein
MELHDDNENVLIDISALLKYLITSSLNACLMSLLVLYILVVKVRRWLPTAAARVRLRVACGVCGGQSGAGAGFLRVLRFPPPIIPPISPLS